jgi:hypothetical protein
LDGAKFTAAESTQAQGRDPRDSYQLLQAPTFDASRDMEKSQRNKYDNNEYRHPVQATKVRTSQIDLT